MNLENNKKIEIFLNCTFAELGLNSANLGTRYFKELIKLAYDKNLYDENYKELCNILCKELNTNYRKIESNIYHSINSININLARKNFKDIFHIEFDYFYMSPKKLVILFLNLLNCKFVEELS